MRNKMANMVSACKTKQIRPDEIKGLPRVVVVGAGFGGLAAAQNLAKAPVNVTVIDRRNYHLFQPLLYQVATAVLSPADIAWPIRHILKKQKNARIIMNEVSGVDSKAKTIALDNGESMSYDYLVLATGARHSYFGKDEWEENAPGIKTVADATALRQKILMSFEKAETEKDPRERERLLTFVIIGGGPTGVELAGAVAELARHSIADDFVHISPECTRIILIEAGDRVLSPFHEKLSQSARKALEKEGVEIKTGIRVEKIDKDGISAGDLHIESRNVIWAAGVKASPAGEWLDVETDRSGRVVVNEQLNIQDHDDIFIVGDTAAHTPKDKEHPLPGVAPVAKQMGQYVANLIHAKTKGNKKKVAKPFEYNDLGSMATIGRNNAVADFNNGIRFTGFIGWWLWGFAHVYFLVGLRNRVTVSMHWFWQYITWQRGVRLITTDDRSLL